MDCLSLGRLPLSPRACVASPHTLPAAARHSPRHAVSAVEWLGGLRPELTQPESASPIASDSATWVYTCLSQLEGVYAHIRTRVLTRAEGLGTATLVAAGRTLLLLG